MEQGRIGILADILSADIVNYQNERKLPSTPSVNAAPKLKDEFEFDNDEPKKMTFGEFMMNEQTLDVDLSNVAAAKAAVVRAARQGVERTRRNAMSKARNNLRASKKSVGPTAQLDAMIARKQLELMQLRKRRDALKKRER